MTEKECLEKMFLIWDYLYRNPDKTKEAAYKDLDLSADQSSCPCCEYVFQPPSCTRCCPLLDLWPDSCSAEDAVYNKWRCAETEAEKQAACQKILIATRKRLKTLTKGAQNG